MPDQDPAPIDKSVHGHTGPTTPAEDSARNAHPSAVPDVDKARIAEEASRAEDA